jgi:hypothetical protein
VHVVAVKIHHATAFDVGDQMPSQEATALKHGVDGLVQKDFRIRSEQRARRACTCAASNSRRNGDVLTSPSALASRAGADHSSHRRNWATIHQGRE